MVAPFRRFGPRPGFPCPAAAGMVLRGRPPDKGGWPARGEETLRGLLIGVGLLVFALLVVLLLPGS